MSCAASVRRVRGVVWLRETSMQTLDVRMPVCLRAVDELNPHARGYANRQQQGGNSYTVHWSASQHCTGAYCVAATHFTASRVER